MMSGVVMNTMTNMMMNVPMTNEKLRIAITTLQTLLFSYNNPDWQHSRFIYYKECHQEDIRICYKFAYRKVCEIMTKQILLRDVIKDVLEKQKSLNTKLESGIYPQENRKRQKDLVTELRKVGYIRRQDEKVFTQNIFSSELQNMMIDFNRRILKFQFLWNAIRTYQMDEKRTFTEYVGEEGMKEFQTQEMNELFEFDDSLKKKGKLESLKNTLNFNTVNKDIFLIQKTLDMMEKVKNLSELEKLLSQNKIEANHRKVFVHFLKNSKKMVKMQQIIQNLKNCVVYDVENMSNVLSEIECDVDLDRKTKIGLKEIGERISQHYKCSKAFTQMNLALDYETVKQLFDYLKNMGRLLQSQISEIEEEKRIEEGEKKLIKNEGKKSNIFKLCQYFQHLICLIKFSDRSSQSKMIMVNDEKYLRSQKQEIKILLDTKDDVCLHLGDQLKKKEEEIKVLKWRIFNLNTKIQQYEEDKQEMLQKMRESVYDQILKKQTQDSAQYIVQLHDQTNDVEVQTDLINQLIVTNQNQMTEVEVQTDMAHQLNKNTENYTQEIEKLRQQINKKQQSLLQKDHQLLLQKQRQSQERAQFQKTISTLKLEIENLEKQLKDQKEQNDKNDKNEQVKKLNLIIAEHELKIVQYSANNSQFEKIYKNLSDQITVKDQEYQKIKNRQEELLNQLQQLKAKEAKETNQILVPHLCYFHCEIFADFRNPELEKQKLALIRAIEGKMGKQIFSTKQIYKFDQKNLISPHKYIDNIKNWVILFQLKNGQIIGTFCQDSLQVGKKSTSGFMFNLKLSKFYNLKKNDKAKIYQYQEYFIVLGNSQIRYRFHEKKLETCFGSNYKFFETEKDTAATFFGQSEEKIQIETFEFHEVVFKQA